MMCLRARVCVAVFVAGVARLTITSQLQQNNQHIDEGTKLAPQKKTSIHSHVQPNQLLSRPTTEYDNVFAEDDTTDDSSYKNFIPLQLLHTLKHNAFIF